MYQGKISTHFSRASWITVRLSIYDSLMFHETKITKNPILPNFHFDDRETESMSMFLNYSSFLLASRSDGAGVLLFISVEIDGV